MADCMLKNRKPLDEDSFVEFKVYSVPRSKQFREGIKYSLSYVKQDVCILRYDNEREKGHHKHFKGKESKISFNSTEKLIEEFEKEVERLRKGD